MRGFMGVFAWMMLNMPKMGMRGGVGGGGGGGGG